MVATPLVEIRNLSLNFKVFEGTLYVLRFVNFIVGKKEKIGVVGEAGCGKTTTMKAILGLFPEEARITNGEVLYEGKDILRMKSKDVTNIRREHISMVMEDPTASLNPVFTVGEQIMDIIKYSEDGLSKEQIKSQAIHLLKEVAMPDPERIMKSYPIELSGGMKQRVCIAMALTSSRDLIIADEPGTSLDVSIRDQIMRLLKETVETKPVSVVLVSHSLGEVKELTDRVYVMYAGEMIETGKTDDIFSDPLHPYTKRLIDSIPKLTGNWIAKGIEGSMVNYLDPPKGCRFFTRCSHATTQCNNKPPLFHVDNKREVACFLWQN